MAPRKISYNAAMAEIEEILTLIEDEQLDVDQLSDKVKRVSFLLKTCKDKLHKTETDVQQVLDELNTDG